MRLHSVVLTCLFAGFGLAHAQAPSPPKPTPEEMQRMMDSTGAMLPTLARMTEVQLEAQLKVAERPETAERIATFKKNLFDALRRKGFTAEQSLQIINSTPWPGAAPLGK
jgi:hypothetical protein